MKNTETVKILWKDVNPVSTKALRTVPDVPNNLAFFFTAGNYYYYTFDFSKLQFDYVHDNILGVLGYSPQEFTLEHWFSIMHPDDVVKMKWKEAAAAEFLFKRIPAELITKYKVSYSFRLFAKDGQVKNILHQALALITKDGLIEYVLGVHTDISHIKKAADDRISFIGIDGQPSYIALSTDPDTFLEASPSIKISMRETQIISLLAEGLTSKEIAAKLGLAKETVDTHRRHLIHKKGCNNTIQLVAYCIHNGLI